MNDPILDESLDYMSSTDSAESSNSKDSFFALQQLTDSILDVVRSAYDAIGAELDRRPFSVIALHWSPPLGFRDCDTAIMQAMIIAMASFDSARVARILFTRPDIIIVKPTPDFATENLREYFETSRMQQVSIDTSALTCEEICRIADGTKYAFRSSTEQGELIFVHQSAQQPADELRKCRVRASNVQRLLELAHCTIYDGCPAGWLEEAAEYPELKKLVGAVSVHMALKI